MNISPRTALNLFDVLIKPILLYNSEIWGLYNNHLINNSFTFSIESSIHKSMYETFHLQFCKFILGVNSKTTNIAVLGELGRFPLYLSVIKYSYKFFLHMSKRKGSLVNAALKESELLMNVGKKSWYLYFAKLLETLGNPINGNSPLNPKKLLLIEHKLLERFKIYWSDQISNIPKLRTYKKVKIVFDYEPYLECNFNIRKLISRIRLSAHKLKIEIGRYEGMRPELRWCPHCNDGTVEDEIHFVLHCKHHHVHRTKLYEAISKINITFLTLNDEAKFAYLLSAVDKVIAVPLGKFINICLYPENVKSDN